MVGVYKVLDSNAPNLASLEFELAERARQQAVVAYLGQKALSGTDLRALMDEAVQLLAQTLGVELCKILQLLPEKDKFLLLAGVGWKEGIVGKATVDTGLNSQAGYTLASHEPVVVEDLHQETRFHGPNLLFEHNVVSGMSVTIEGWNHPFGVLGVHSPQRRVFTRDDINFLQSVANILAAAIGRKQFEDSLVALNATLEKRVEQGVGYVSLLKEVAVSTNEASNIEEALQFVINRVCFFTGWPVGHVYWPVADPSNALFSLDRPPEVTALIPTDLWFLKDPEKFKTFREITEKTALEPGEGLVGRVFRSGQPAWIKNISADLNFKRAKLASDLGVISGFAFPILVGQEVAAVLEFFSDLEYEPDSEMLEVMAQIGTQTGRVVERVRANHELKQRQVQLEEAQQLTHIGSWDWNIKTNQVRYSDELYRIFGLDPKAFEATYEGFLQRVHPEDRDLVDSTVRKALEDFQPFAFYHRIVLPDGTQRNIHGQGKVILDEKGRPAKMLGTAQDLTERIELEDALRRSVHLLEGLFEAAPDGILLVDQGGTIVRINQQGEVLFGYDREELLGKPLEVLLPKRFWEDYLRHRENHSQRPGPWPVGVELELFARRKDQSEFPVDVVLNPLKTDQDPLVIALVRDVTNRKQAAEMLRQSEARFRSLIENARDIISILDADGMIRYESPSMKRAVGYEPTELIGKSIFDFIHPEDLKKVSEVFRINLTRPGTSDGITLRFRHQDGSWRVLDATLKNLLEEQAIQGVVVNSRDITEQRQAEEALRHSEARFRAIYENAPLGIAVVDLERRILSTNPAFESMLGFQPEELYGKDLISLTHPQDAPTALTFLSRLLTGKREHYKLEKRYLRKDGKFMWGSFTVSLVRDAEGNPRFAIKMLEDITSRKQMEAELAEVQHRLLESRELERTQLAQELHDVPIQDLYGILYQLNDFDDLMLDEESQEQWSKVWSTVQGVIQTLRGICGELRSPTLDPFGIEGAIREHAEQFKEKNPHIQVSLDLKPDGNRLSEQIRLNLFRIYQQAMTNIIRHAEATEVEVLFSWDEDQVTLQVGDNGKGFEVPTRWIGLVRQGHLGLVGAAERAELIGGRFQVTSNPGEGTQIKVTLPRKAEDQELGSPYRNRI
jgi:PAS domain S-box-containing protein